MPGLRRSRATKHHRQEFSSYFESDICKGNNILDRQLRFDRYCFYMDSPKTLQQAIQHFADYENCRRFMIGLRWPDGRVCCPRCGSARIAYLHNARVYRCHEGHAKEKFSLKVGTVMEDSPIGLDKWLPVMWMMVNCKNGISQLRGGTRQSGLLRSRLGSCCTAFALRSRMGHGGKLGGLMAAL